MNHSLHTIIFRSKISHIRVFHNQTIVAHIALKISLLRSQKKIQNMLTTLYVMQNVLNHCNAIVPHITPTMVFVSFSKSLCINMPPFFLIRSNWITVIIQLDSR